MGLQQSIQSLDSNRSNYQHLATCIDSDPQSLERWRFRSIRLHQQGYIREAIECYQEYLRIVPDDVGLWSNLGAAMRSKKCFQSAINCYRRALEIQPKNIYALSNLANALKDLHRYEEALKIHNELLKENPDSVQILINYAVALRETGDFVQALALLDRAKVLDPKNAGIEWERSQQLLYLNRYKEGWVAFESRWKTGQLPIVDYGVPQWHGESLDGKSILLHAEQGYGDTILAARFIKQVKQKSAYVIFECKPELHRVFKDIGADILVVPNEFISDNSGRFKSTPIDYHCPLMSLMAPLGIEPATIPPPALLYIPCDSRKKFQFIGLQSSAYLKVGIVWSGSNTFANNTQRSVLIDEFLPLLEIPGMRFYSLQKGPEQEQLQRTGADSVITPLGSRLSDFADTAAAIKELDVVVMTDSSVAHLAASLGKPIINLLQKTPYWLYSLASDTTPWYSSMTLIKQREAGEWNYVFEAAKNLLMSMRENIIKTMI